MGDTLSCEPNSKHKELIIRALMNADIPDSNARDAMRRLAECVEMGKVSINGCTTFQVETDKTLVEIIDKYKGGPPRELARLLSMALRVEANAMTSYQRMNSTFYEKMRVLRSGGQISNQLKR